MNRMVEKPIPHTRLVNVTLFWIVDSESPVWAMSIRSLCEFLVEHNDVVRKVYSKFANIFPVPLATQKFLQGSKEILDGNDILVDMTQPPSTLSLSRKTPRSSVGSKRDTWCG